MLNPVLSEERSIILRAQWWNSPPPQIATATHMTGIVARLLSVYRYGILFSSRHCCEESAPLIRIDNE